MKIKGIMSQEISVILDEVAKFELHVEYLLRNAVRNRFTVL